MPNGRHCVDAADESTVLLLTPNFVIVEVKFNKDFRSDGRSVARYAAPISSFWRTSLENAAEVSHSAEQRTAAYRGVGTALRTLIAF